MENPFAIAVFFTLVFMVLTYGYAEYKNRNPWKWLLLAFIFGPIPFIVLIWMPTLDQEETND